MAVAWVDTAVAVWVHPDKADRSVQAYSQAAVAALHYMAVAAFPLLNKYVVLFHSLSLSVLLSL